MDAKTIVAVVLVAFIVAGFIFLQIKQGMTICSLSSAITTVTAI